MRGYGKAAALGAAAAIMTALSAITAGAAASNPADGPYLRLEGGLSLPSHISGTVAANPPTPSTNIELSPHVGPFGGGALGLRLAPFSIEIDGDWMRSTLKSNAPALTGRIQNIPVMANAFIDFDNATRLTPYIGFGLGVSFVSLKANAASGSGSALIDSRTHAFAFQPMIGVNLQLTDRLTAGMQYRYFKSVDPWLSTRSGQRLSINNASNIVLATLTFHFFAPPASTPAEIRDATPALALTPGPAPAPVLYTASVASRAAPRMFFVFFDFDSAKLNGPGRHAADAAIASYRANPTTNLAIRGFTDEVGTDAYNLELSKRRAMTVYEYFAAQGVKPSDVGIDWQGKANPRVPATGREAQNRRVEIQM